MKKMREKCYEVGEQQSTIKCVVLHYGPDLLFFQTKQQPNFQHCVAQGGKQRRAICTKSDLLLLLYTVLALYQGCLVPLTTMHDGAEVRVHILPLDLYWKHTPPVQIPMSRQIHKDPNPYTGAVLCTAGHAMHQ